MTPSRTVFTLCVLIFAAVSLRAQVTFRPTSTGGVRPPADIVGTMRSMPQKNIVITVPTSMGDITLTGERFDLFLPEAVLVAGTHVGDVYTDIPDHALMRGSVAGRPGSSVFIAAFPTHVVGIIDIPEPGGSRRLMIVPDAIVPGRMAEHSVVDGSDTPASPSRCHAEELPDYQRRTDSILAIVRKHGGEQMKGDAGQRNIPYALHLAVDCSYSFFLKHDGSLTTAAEYAIAILGASSTVYARDANVHIRLPYLRIWTKEDPYPGEIGDALGHLLSYWNDRMKYVSRSATMLLSSSVGGGLAYVGVLCSDYGYSVCGVGGNVNLPAWEGYIWDVDVTSHELGHNIGSSHTHNCSWEPPIDSCWNAEGGCFDATLPRRGTIMSYCHLTALGTSLEFHPRVSTLFGSVMAQRDCITSFGIRRDTAIQVVMINAPQPGAIVAPRAQFRPEAILRNTGRLPLSAIAVRAVVTTPDGSIRLTKTSVIPKLGMDETFTVRFDRMSLDSAGDYLLRIEVVDILGATPGPDNSMTRPFRIATSSSASISVVSPNGGELLRAGQDVDVTWDARDVKRVLVEYSTDDGKSWATVRFFTDAAQKRTTWKVPAIPSSQCRVRISSQENSDISDMSDDVFTIGVDKDVQAFDIIDPRVNGKVMTPVVPRIVIRNNGAMDIDAIDVRLTMKWVRDPDPVYDTVIRIARLPLGRQDTIPFPATALLPEGTVTMRLQVTAAGDVEPANDVFARSFDAGGLAAPYHLTVEDAHEHVVLRWSLRTTDDSTQVELLKGVAGGPLTRLRIVSSSVSTYVDDAVTNGTSYTYAARVIRGSRTSVRSSSVTALPRRYPAGVKLVAPQLVSPAHGQANVPIPAQLVWTNVDGADQYEVQIAQDADFRQLVHVAVVRVEGTWTMPMLFNSKYWWRIRAFNPTYVGPWSRSQTFSVTDNCSGKAMKLDGATSRAYNAAFVWPGGPVTVEFWRYVDVETNSTLFSIGESDNTGNRFQAHAPWGDQVVYWDYGNLNANGRLTAWYGPYIGKWTHVALVSDGAAFKAIYFDGKLVSSERTASTPTNLQYLNIGSMRDQLFSSGMVDEFRIWSVVRTQEEIRENMNRRLPNTIAGLMGCWRFLEGTGESVSDVSPQHRSLTINGKDWTPSAAPIGCDDVYPMMPPRPVAETPGNDVGRTDVATFRWQGVDEAQWYEFEIRDSAKPDVVYHHADNISATFCDVAGLPSGTSFIWRVRGHSANRISPWRGQSFMSLQPCYDRGVDFGKQAVFVDEDFVFDGRAATVEFWCYVPSQDLGNESAFVIGTADSSENRFQAHTPWSDKTLYWDFGSWAQGGRLTAPYESSLDRWRHVALVSDGFDDMRIYFDGQLVSHSSFADSPTGKKRIAIGSNTFGNWRQKGRLSDLRIWNVPRTEEQIRESMYRRYNGSESGLLGSWPMDDGSGRDITDASGYDGTAMSTDDVEWLPMEGRSLPQALPYIVGPRSVERGSEHTYQVRGRIGSGFVWTVRQGTILTGQGTPIVTVKWSDAEAAGRLTVVRTFEGGCIDSSGSNVVLGVPVGVVEDIIPSHGVRVMPNPASDVVRLTWNHGDDVTVVEVVDMLGRRMHRTTVDDHDAVTIDVSAFPAGAYVVLLHGRNVANTLRTTFVVR